MSDTDSFISEVNEEVRRDRLYQLFRRWWWAGALVIIGAVGGATYFELQRAANESEAQAFGDAIIAALDEPTPTSRINALEGIAAGSVEAELILALFAAGEAASADEAGTAADRLRLAVVGDGLPRRYRDLALLKAELLDPSEPTQARIILGELAQPGAPYAALAAEQLALLDVSEGNLEAGLDGLRALERSAAATPALQQRAAQLIVALSAGAELIDTAPVEEPSPDDATAQEAPTEEAPTEEAAPDQEDAAETDE